MVEMNLFSFVYYRMDRIDTSKEKGKIDLGLEGRVSIQRYLDLISLKVEFFKKTKGYSVILLVLSNKVNLKPSFSLSFKVHPTNLIFKVNTIILSNLLKWDFDFIPFINLVKNLNHLTFLKILFI